MGLFDAIVRTVVNVATLPVTLPLAVTKDILTMGGELTDQDESYTKQLVEQIKEEAETD